MYYSDVGLPDTVYIYECSICKREVQMSRIIKCDICNKTETEPKTGGWPGWGILTGKQGPNGELDFALCPDHLDAVFEFINNLMGNNKE